MQILDSIENFLNNYASLITLIALIISFFSFIIAAVTLFIAQKIAFIQQWDTLVNEYRSYEFGEAIKSICDFYIDKCNRQPELIEKKYCEQFYSDSNQNKDYKAMLHSQRRLLAQYYWQLLACVKGKYWSHKYIRKYFTKNEMNLIAIIYYMSMASDNNQDTYRPLVKKEENDIQKEESSICKELHNLYEIFGKIFEDNTDEVIALDKNKHQINIRSYSMKYEKKEKVLFISSGKNNDVLELFVADIANTKNYIGNFKEISKEAFKNISKIEKIRLSETIEKIGEEAFMNCADLHTVLIGFSKTDLESKEAVSFGNGKNNLHIQSSAFKNCINLETVIIRCKKLNIDKHAFLGCSKLRVIIIDCSDDVDLIQEAFSNYSNLKIFISDSTPSKDKIKSYCNENKITLKELK